MRSWAVVALPIRLRARSMEWYGTGCVIGAVAAVAAAATVVVVKTVAAVVVVETVAAVVVVQTVKMFVGVAALAGVSVVVVVCFLVGVCGGCGVVAATAGCGCGGGRHILPFRWCCGHRSKLVAHDFGGDRDVLELDQACLGWTKARMPNVESCERSGRHFQNAT